MQQTKKTVMTSQSPEILRIAQMYGINGDRSHLKNNSMSLSGLCYIGI